MFNVSWFIIAVLLVISYTLYVRNKRQAKQIEDLIFLQSKELQSNIDYRTQLENNLQNVEEKLKEVSKDPITHTLGWQFFEESMKQTIEECMRYKFTMGFLLVEIDDFGIIDETIGNSSEVLRETANRLIGSIRKVDILSRASKSRFGILLTQLSKPETAAIVAQRILRTLSESYLVNGREYFLTASIGISIYPTDSNNVETLIRHAEVALAVAKEKEKHGYQFYNDKMNVNSLREVAIHNSLRQRSIIDELVLYFTPIYDVETNKIFCMDALLKWQHKELGLIEREEFNPYADRHRKLNMISEWLIESACQKYLSWQQFNFKPKYLGIPLTFKELENSQFIYRISQILQKTGFNAENLLIEIQGNLSQASFDVIEKTTNMLRYMGVNFLLDNFGGDGITLAQLKNLQADYLRLASVITKDLDADARGLALFKGIQSLANNLNIAYIVEEVETKEQVKVLEAYDCHLMQGGYFGLPILAKEVEKEIKAVTITETL